MAESMSRKAFSATVLVLLLLVVWQGRTRTQSASPQPGEAAHKATYVGAKACAKCHQDVYDSWKSARHSKMIQPATPASVEADFSRSSITLRGRTYRLRAADGEFFISESYLTGKEQEHRVEYTLGSRRIQHFLTTIGNGRIIVLPPSWDVQRHQWFDNMEIVRPDEDVKKPFQQWNALCFGCHVSQQDNHYVPSTQTYATTWSDFGTSCERCHGPGSAHVAEYTRDPEPAAHTDRLIVRPTRLDPKTSSMICAQCHSMRDVIAPGYAPGLNYYDYFVPDLEYGPRKASDPTYWADGRPRRFSNDAIGFWQSQCFLQGGATCTSCHRDPHVPNIERNSELRPENNALCVRCHQDVGAQLTAHTRHSPSSAGSSCVECHMPKTVISIKATMRDHTIGVPAPENTVRFGIPNACTECHKDKKAAWAVAVLDKWWPQGRRTKLVRRAEAFTAGRAADSKGLEALVAIAADDTEGPLVQANAVGYLRNYRDPRAIRALLAAAKASAPAIRIAAIAGLGQVGIDNAAARSVIDAGLNDPERGVRLSALVSLINLGRGPLAAEEQAPFRRVSGEFAGWAHLHQDDARAQCDLGMTELLLGEFNQAADALKISLDLEPDRPSAKFLLALARLGQRRPDDATKLLKEVPASDPYFNAAQARLKQLGLSR